MDAVAIFGIAGTLLSAAVTYVVMDYRHNDARQNSQDESLKAQSRVLAAQKALAGYTHYLSLLTEGQQTLMDHLSTLSTPISREQADVETLRLGGQHAGSEAAAVITYTVDYTLGFKFKANELTVVGTTEGIEIRLPPPTVLTQPVVRPLAWRVAGGGVLADEAQTLKALQAQLPERALGRARAVCADPAVRALCERKLTHLLHQFFCSQTGVTQIPAISVVYA